MGDPTFENQDRKTLLTIVRFDADRTSWAGGPATLDSLQRRSLVEGREVANDGPGSVGPEASSRA